MKKRKKVLWWAGCLWTNPGQVTSEHNQLMYILSLALLRMWTKVCNCIFLSHLYSLSQIIEKTNLELQRKGLPWWLSGKESACQCRRHKRCGFNPWARKIPWRRKWQPTPVFLPEKSHGQRSLVGYSPWGCERVRHHWALHKRKSVEMLPCWEEGSEVLIGPFHWMTEFPQLPFWIYFSWM